jgi:hypothetical protein
MSTDASETTIRIAFGGEALQSGTMDVRDFAPALLALSDLFDESNKILNGGDSAVQLRIQHDIKRGSFDVTIRIVQTLMSKILDLFSGDHASVVALVAVIGFVAGPAGLSLFRLLKLVRGRPVVKAEFIDKENGVRLTIQGDDGQEVIVISRQVASLYNDLGIRRTWSRFLAPLNRDGIESLEVKTLDGAVVESVSKKELPAFEAPPADVAPQKINTSEFTQAYTIVSLSFKDGNRWRVTDGQSTISVTIEDASFLARVNNHDVSFSKDDVIRCAVRQEQTMTPDGLKTETAITKVIQHQHTYRQTVWPMLLDPGQQTGDTPSLPKEPAPKETKTEKKHPPKRASKSKKSKKN